MFVFSYRSLRIPNLSDIDFKYKDNPGQKAYPAAMQVRVILLGTIYSIHSDHKLKRIIRENLDFIYLSGFQQPALSIISAFKRENQEILEKIFLETINFGYDRNLINFNRINVDKSKN